MECAGGFNLFKIFKFLPGLLILCESTRLRHGAGSFPWAARRDSFLAPAALGFDFQERLSLAVATFLEGLAVSSAFCAATVCQTLFNFRSSFR
jgi:hypothetical protein